MYILYIIGFIYNRLYKNICVRIDYIYNYYRIITEIISVSHNLVGNEILVFVLVCLLKYF